MKAYKLFRVLKNGEITPLFINKSKKLPIGEWMPSENHPTKGYKERQGWHCTTKPSVPHLSNKGRAWYEIEIADFTEEIRPEPQGGLWYLAHNMKIIKEVAL